MWTSAPPGPPIARPGAPTVREGLAASTHLIRYRPPSLLCSPLVRVKGQLSTWLLVVAIIPGALLTGCGDAGSAESEIAAPATSSSEPAAKLAELPEPATVGDLFPEGLGRQLTAPVIDFMIAPLQ